MPYSSIGYPEIQKSPIDLGGSLVKGIAARLEAAKAQEQENMNPYVAPQAEANVKSTLLKNIYQNLVNQNTPEDYKTQFDQRRASTANLGATTSLSNLKLKYPGLGEGGIVGQLAYANLLADHPQIAKSIQAAMQSQEQAQGQKPLAEGLESAMQGNSRQFDPLQILMKDINADIGGKQALADYRNAGGGRGGVTAQQQMMLQHEILRDNPNLTPDQAFEAAGNLVNGQATLNDGTPIKVSGLTKLSADKAVMQGTTSSLVTQGVKANQAEAELKVLNDYAQKGLAPYGDTFMGMNSNQIMDTFKNDDVSQKRLGKFVASQALQYEAAQNRIRLANGQPGVTSSEELMKLSGQMVKARYPALSYKARQEAAKYLDEALEQGLQARNQVGFHPSNVNSNVPRLGHVNRKEIQRISEESKDAGLVNVDLSHMSDDELRNIANG